MTTLYLKPKEGETNGKVIKNISPGGVEENKFYYHDQYDVLHEVNQDRVTHIKTDNKASACEYASMFKDTERYIVVVQVKSDYHVWLDNVEGGTMSTDRIVRVINASQK